MESQKTQEKHHPQNDTTNPEEQTRQEYAHHFIRTLPNPLLISGGGCWRHGPSKVFARTHPQTRLTKLPSDQQSQLCASWPSLLLESLRLDDAHVTQLGKVLHHGRQFGVRGIPITGQLTRQPLLIGVLLLLVLDMLLLRHLRQLVFLCQLLVRRLCL